MSSSNTNQIKPRRTIVHYKYRLLLKLGLDPYEAPENVTYNYDTWSEVCQGISTHLGQIIDKTDESICHCGKWYITNHGRGKIIQIVDFYEYEYDSDTEREIQQTENNTGNEQESDTNEVEAHDEEFFQSPKYRGAGVVLPPFDEESSEEEVESLHTLIKNNRMSIGELQETAKKCVDEVMSCNIL